MNRTTLYDILYALLARDGREAALFGDDGRAAREAFARSLVGDAFPELWFELPLAGEPWLDFHALTAHEDVAGGDDRAAYAGHGGAGEGHGGAGNLAERGLAGSGSADAEHVSAGAGDDGAHEGCADAYAGHGVAYAGHGGAYADALGWFAAQKAGTVRQLALSYDTHEGDVDHPAVQLLVNGPDVAVPLAFLAAVGREDLCAPYAGFAERMPPAWYACYVGVFPGRARAGADPWVRVECIVGDERQGAYALDASALGEDLAKVGLGDVGADAVAGIQELARTPFPLELQFDVGPDGARSSALSASVRFQPSDWMNEARRAAIGRLAGWMQCRGVADERCARLAETVFAKRATRGGTSVTLTCFPAFVKLRWRDGVPPDAKAYLLALVG